MFGKILLGGVEVGMGVGVGVVVVVGVTRMIG